MFLLSVNVFFGAGHGEDGADVEANAGVGDGQQQHQAPH